MLGRRIHTDPVFFFGGGWGRRSKTADSATTCVEKYLTVAQTVCICLASGGFAPIPQPWLCPWTPVPTLTSEPGYNTEHTNTKHSMWTSIRTTQWSIKISCHNSGCSISARKHGFLTVNTSLIDHYSVQFTAVLVTLFLSQTVGNCCSRTFTGRMPFLSLNTIKAVFPTRDSMLPQRCQDIVKGNVGYIRNI